MRIVNFSYAPLLSVMLAPLQALSAWLMPSQHVARAPSRQFFKPSGDASVSTEPWGECRRQLPGAATARPAALAIPSLSRLKVVREFDVAMSSACAGRMVISGRMADVCAELERMARREDTAQQSRIKSC